MKPSLQTEMKAFILPVGKWCCFLCTLALAFLFSPAGAEDDFSIIPGLSAHWYDPERNGEGLALEILSDESALVYWFTYDDQGTQRWLLDVGRISGNRIEFPELVVTRGGRFGPDFDSEEVEMEVVGEATLSFSDCDHALFSYDAFGQSGTMDMVRLSQTMAAGCQPAHGVPGQPIREYAGQSGSWYDRSQSGHGYTLQWMSRDEAVLIWFTYDTEGNQFWMLGVGSRVDGEIVFPTLHATRGPRFGAAFDSEELELVEWGQLVLNIDCEAGTAVYDSVIDEFGSGQLFLNRLTALSKPACPWEQPKLTDLFEIDYEELEIEPTTPMNRTSIRARDISEDGTVLAFDRGFNELRIRHPGSNEWELLREDVATGAEAFISDDSKVVVATETIRTSSEPVEVLIWERGVGWKAIADPLLHSSLAAGVSRNFSHIVGFGRFVDDSRQVPFIWDAERGQRALPTTDDVRAGRPVAVSNNGRVVTGFVVIPRQGTTPTAKAIRWIDGGEPEVLVDDIGAELAFALACSANCEVLYGTDQFEVDFNHPNFRQAFYLTQAGAFQYLGVMENAVELAGMSPYRLVSTTADGTIAVGSYLIEIAPATLGSDALIWTQNTGLVSVRGLLEELNFSDNDWRDMTAQRITGSGGKILLAGIKRSNFNARRAAVITLQAR